MSLQILKVLFPGNNYRIDRIIEAADATYLASDQAGTTYLTQASAASTYAIDRTVRLQAQRNWRYAISNRHFSPARSLWFGTSIFEGQGASTPSNRMIERFNTQLRSRFPTNGSSVGGRGYLSMYSNTFASDSNWEFNDSSSGTIVNQGQSAIPGSLKGHSSLFSSAATRTFTVTGTSIDVWWARTVGGGGFTVTVDGGAPSATQSTAGTYGSNFRTQAYSLGTAGVHTVVITATANNTYIEGIFVYNGDETTGFHLYDDARTGDPSGSRISAGVVSTNTIANWNLAAPDLIVCDIFINDYLSSTALATTQANLQLYINAWKALTKIPSVVFFVPVQPSSISPTIPYQSYVDLLNAFSVAEPTMISVYDARKVAPQANTSGLLLNATDGTHLNNRGQAFIAEDFVNFIAA